MRSLQSNRSRKPVSPRMHFRRRFLKLFFLPAAQRQGLGKGRVLVLPLVGGRADPFFRPLRQHSHPDLLGGETGSPSVVEGTPGRLGMRPLQSDRGRKPVSVACISIRDF